LLSFLWGYSPEVRRNFKFDLISGMSFGLFFGAVNSFVLVQARRLGATPVEVSVLAALPYAWMLFSPLWAKLWGNHDPFKIVWLSDGIGRFLLIFLLFNRSVHWYLVIFCLLYLFGAISSTVYGKALRFAYPVEDRGILLGWVRVGVSLMMIISSGLAGILLPWWGVHWFFAALSIFGIGAAYFFGKLRKVSTETTVETPEKSSPMTILRTDSNFRGYMGALLVFGLSSLMSLPIYTLYQVDSLKVSDQFISLLSLFTSCSSLVFYYIWGRFIDRHSSMDLTVIVFAINLVIPLVYLFTGNPWPLLLAAIVQGVVNAGIDLAYLNNVLSFSKGREISPYMAAHINLLGLRGTVGPLLGPFLVEIFTLKGFFVFVFLLNLVGLWQGYRVLNRVAQKNREPVSVAA
jgi:MFS transporter, DHA1 family, staphyloferrin B biosynthesis exporter